jgi:hypothetical protein
VVIYTPKGTNNTVELLFGTSLYDLKAKQMPPKADLVERQGLRLFAPATGTRRTTMPTVTAAMLWRPGATGRPSSG